MAQIISFKTGHPVGDVTSNVESMVLLSLLASRAMESGADPSAMVSPDHDLLMLCDEIIMRKRQVDKTFSEWRAGNPFQNQRDGYDDWKRENRSLRGPLVRLGKLRAATPVGIFAKAVVAHRIGPSAAYLAVSLASDLLSSPGLREAIWPAAQDLPPVSPPA
jgi:hypothetical protein